MGARWHRLLSPLAAAAPLFLAACGGGLDTPDVTRGDVVVQIDGAATGAFAYVLGRPEIYGEAAPDGSVTLPDVPVGTTKIVVFDGRGLDQDGRAELVDVSVKGAERSRMRRNRDDMPRAARVRAGSSCADPGVPTVGADLEVVGPNGETTRLKRKKGNDEAEEVEFYPVPKGTWKIRAQRQDYRDEIEVVVDDDDEPADLELEKD